MRGRKHIAIALLLLGSAALGEQGSAPVTPTSQTPQQQQTTQAAAQKATVQGTIFKAGAGLPLKKARVTMRRTDLSGAQTGQLPGLTTQSQQGRNATVQATTDDNGRYSFSVDPGQYRISADRDGYVHQEYGERSYGGVGATVTIAGGQTINNLDMQLSPAGTIAGRITDEDGEPLVRAQVVAQSYTYSQGKRTLVQNTSAETNDLGEYRLYWLPPGDYYVSAMARPSFGGGPRGGGPGGPGGGFRGGGPGAPGPSAPSGPEETYVSTFFPGTTVPESASSVGLGPAAEVRGIDIMLRPMRTLHIRGTAIMPVGVDVNSLPTGRGGNPQRGIAAPRGPQINISLTRMGYNGRSTGFTGGPQGRANVSDDGSFDVQGVIPGTYTLVAVSRQGTTQYTARARVDIGDSDMNNVGLTLRPSVNVIGRIAFDGPPSSTFQMNSIRVSFVSTDDAQFGGGVNTQLAADGTFSLANVPPLEYRVRLSGLPTGSFVQSGTIGSYDAVNGAFVVSGERDVAMQLLVSFAVGSLQGTVVDGKGDPYQGATVALVPDEPARQRPELYFSATTDQYGQFTINNVPKGGYKLFAWDQIPSGAYQDPDFIGRYEDHGKPVKIGAGSGAMEQVKIISNP